MMEPWLAGFLIGFFGIMAAILILHKTMEWGCPRLLLLLLLFLAVFFWDDAFSCLNHVIPAEVSPFQSTAERMGYFLGAASSCIWLDAPKGEKVRKLLCVDAWQSFTIITAIYLIGITESILMFSNTSPFTAYMVWRPAKIFDRKEDNKYGFILWLTVWITIIWISVMWLLRHSESSGFATGIYERDMIDMTGCMIYMFLSISLFYGKPKKEEE